MGFWSMLTAPLGRTSDISAPSRHAMGDGEPDYSLDRYGTDIHRAGQVAIGAAPTPEDIIDVQYWARYGDPRRLYEIYDSFRRMGPSPQIRRAMEAMKSARADFITCREELDDDDALPDDASPDDITNARMVRDVVKQIMGPAISRILAEMAWVHFYGISGTKLKLRPRGTLGKYESIDGIERIPARRFRLDPITHKWMLMLSPNSYQGTPIEELALRPDRGLDGLFFCELGAGADHLDQRGLHYEALDWWCAEMFGIRRWVDFLDTFGIPPRIGFTDLANKTRAGKMAEMLRKMGNRTWGLFQTGSEVKLLEARAMGGGHTPHKEFADAAKGAYNAIYLGHEETTSTKPSTGNRDVTTGAISQLQEITNTRLDPLAVDLTRLARVIVARNLGAEYVEWSPIIKLTFVVRDDPESLSKVAATLYTANAGTGVELYDLVKRCGLKPAKNGAASLGSVAAAAAAPPPTQAMSLSTDVDREFHKMLNGQLGKAKQAALAYARTRVRT